MSMSSKIKKFLLFGALLGCFGKDGKSQIAVYIISGPNLPAHCSVTQGQVYFKTTATVGIYYYSKGSDYVKYAEQMIDKNVRVNNEFYVAPVFNEAILDGKKIRIKEAEKMWGIGTPEDLNYFLQHHE